MNQNEIRQKLGKRLKELRGNIRCEDMAGVLNIKRPTYQAYEEGRAVPPLAILIELRDFYGFKSIDDLLIPGKVNDSFDPLLKAYKRAPEKVKMAVDGLLGL